MPSSSSEDKIVANEFLGDVIEINGECYEFIGPTAKTHDITSADNSYATCEACEGSLSTSSSSSLSSSSSSSSSDSSSLGITSSSSDSSSTVDESTSSDSSSTVNKSTSSNSSSSSSGGGALAEVNCGASTDPRIKITLCWTDSDVTKSFLTSSWTNGESKLICPDFYVFSGPNEIWSIKNGGTASFVANYPYDIYQQNIVKIVGTSLQGSPQLYMGTGSYGATHSVANNLASFSPNLAGVALTKTHVSNDKMGFMTTSTGLTFKWEMVSGSGQPWNSWKGTGISYVPATGNEICP